MNRVIRYQGAIVQNDQLLLIRQQEHESGESYWLFPGGGIEAGETEEACVEREMQEETNLEVRAERLILDEPATLGGIYKRRKSYLCTIQSGTASPGYEPEVEAAEEYAIVEVRWFDLRDESSWPQLAKDDAITYPQLLRVKAILGY